MEDLVPPPDVGAAGRRAPPRAAGQADRLVLLRVGLQLDLDPRPLRELVDDRPGDGFVDAGVEDEA